MIYKYLGTSNSLVGASIIQSKPIITVEEGYQIGATAEYALIGNFELDSYSTNHYEDNSLTSTIEFEASALHNRSSINTITLPVQWRSGTIYRNDFRDTADLNDFQFSINGYGVTNRTLQILYPETRSFIVYESPQLYSDFVIDTTLKRNTLAGMGVGFRGNGAAILEDYNSYLAWMANNTLTLYTVTNGVNTVLSVKNGVSIGPDESYTLRVHALQNNIQVWGSTDNVNYTKHIEVFDRTYPQGFVSLRNAAGVSSIFNYSNFGIIENRPIYTYADIIQKAYKLSDVDNVGFYNILQSNPSSSGTSGYTWGVSNDRTGIINIVGGTAYYSQARFFAFPFRDEASFECEIKGSSGTRAGVMLTTDKNATTVSFINPITFGYGLTPLFVEMLNDSGGVSIMNTATAPTLDIRSDLWYKVKANVRNGVIRWFINDSLSGFTDGVSFFGGSAYFSIAAWQGVSIVSGVVRYREPKIDELFEIVEDVQVEENQKISNIIDRLVPDQFFTFQGSTRTSIESYSIRDSANVRIGITSTSTVLPIATDIQRSTDLAINRGIILVGQDSLSLTYTDNTERATSRGTSIIANIDYNRRVSSNIYEYVNDQNIQSSTYNERQTFVSARSFHADRDTFNIEIGNNPTLEVNDDVVYTNLELSLNTVTAPFSGVGSSNAVVVRAFTKSYNPEEGYRVNLTLSQKGS